jgi:GMP synthase-like glutamine amidotransferase
MRIHCLTHVSFETPARITKWAVDRGHEILEFRLWEKTSLPDPGSVNHLIVMGGPMSANDESRYPRLRAEKELIRDVHEQGKRILGICLGAQLIASALGARVAPNHTKEIGWFPVRLTEPGRQSPFFRELPVEFTVFQWHGETFDLPSGAELLAESRGCRNQAFSIGDRLLGLQFHLELMAADITALVEHCRSDMTSGPYVQAEEALLAGPSLQALPPDPIFSILDSWAGGSEYPDQPVERAARSSQPD